MDKNRVYFITGSQDLYGEETLKQVALNSQAIVESLNSSKTLSLEVVWQPTVRNQDEICQIMKVVNNDDSCVGIITWMHTFSPAKMWINGLKLLNKPMLHLATQFNQMLPWSTIDMDFMNLNQAAHGDREFGFICTRLNIPRKVVVGFYTDNSVLRQIDTWMRVANAWSESQNLRVARIGDNMRHVAVTEGNKVSAQIQFGFSTNTYGIGDVVKFISEVPPKERAALVKEYEDLYTIIDKSDMAMKAIYDAAQQEIGIKAFLDSVGAKAFTTTFEDLYGLNQLPGLACQRLMAQGYGFAAEGDWKSAAMLRLMKVMANGFEGGSSFMEDYTYHLECGRERVLGSHMLEVCPSIASAKPTLEVHPLGIGGKNAPARLVFDTAPSEAINVSLIDLGDKFRVVVNEVNVVKADEVLPKLPVARAVWEVKPNFHTGVQSWIEAGAAHHSIFSQALTVDHIETFANMANIEIIKIR